MKLCEWLSEYSVMQATHKISQSLLNFKKKYRILKLKTGYKSLICTSEVQNTTLQEKNIQASFIKIMDQCVFVKQSATVRNSVANFTIKNSVCQYIYLLEKFDRFLILTSKTFVAVLDAQCKYINCQFLRHFYFHFFYRFNV